MKEKICVYTCITGDYDEISEIETKEKNIDYYLFTNNKNIKSDTWNVIYIDNPDNLDNIRLARKIKILGNEITKKYDITIWLDGASYIRKSIKEFIEKYINFDEYSLIGFKHRERDCIYDEALECVKVRKDNKDIIKKQMDKYKKEKYPKHNGLIESTILFRKNNDKTLDKTMKLWFEEIKKFSYRDQLSFNYVANITKLQYKLLDINVFDNEFFGWKKHNEQKSLENFNVYFDDDKDFNYDSIYLGKYKKNNNKYIGEFKVLKNTNIIKIELSNSYGIKFNNLKIENNNIEKQNLVNWSQYLDYNIFDGGTPTVFIHGNFKKNNIITFSIEMNFMTDDEYLNIIKRLNTLVCSLNDNKSIINRIKNI